MYRCKAIKMCTKFNFYVNLYYQELMIPVYLSAKQFVQIFAYEFSKQNLHKCFALKYTGIINSW